jgi:hypothetical protein
MSEIKFKYGTTIEGKTVGDSDIVMVNNTMGVSEGIDTNEEKLGSVYRGSKIVGTTKASELCLTEEITVSNPVGNIITGDKLTKGMSVEDILIELLSAPVEYPSYTEASISYGSISNKGDITEDIETPYVGQTVTYTYPATATATITINKTKYKNGGSDTSSIPSNTTQSFYTNSTEDTEATPAFEIKNGDNSWVAAWDSSKTVKQQLVANNTIYAGAVLNSDGTIYIPLDSNGNESNKTGKYETEYSAVYAVNENGKEERIAINVSKTLDGATESTYGHLPYSQYFKGSEPESYSFEKIRKSEAKTWNTDAIKSSKCPTYIIPYQYKTATGSWSNTGKIELSAVFGGTTFNFVINAGSTDFSSGTNLNVGKVEVLSDIYVLDVVNGTWSISEDATDKVAVRFLKIQLMTDGNSTDSKDKCTVKIG